VLLRHLRVLHGVVKTYCNFPALIKANVHLVVATRSAITVVNSSMTLKECVRWRGDQGPNLFRNPCFMSRLPHQDMGTTGLILQCPGFATRPDPDGEENDDGNAKVGVKHVVIGSTCQRHYLPPMYHVSQVHILLLQLPRTHH